MATEGHDPGQVYGAHLIGKAEVGYGYSLLLKDKIVTMSLWAHDIPAPGHFAMTPDQARLLADSLREMADKVEADNEL